jgi:DNA-binding LacI/PurR family transcriptional regulator
MARSKSSPALQGAVRYMRGKIASGAWRKGERVPAIQRLARSAGVSKPTVIKAIRQLKNEGLIHGADRHRTRVGRADPYEETDIEPSLQWQKKRLVVERDLLYGRIGNRGRLPSLKVMRAHYGLSFATAKKIIAAMSGDGVIVPMGKSYALPAIATDPAGRRIVFVTMKSHQSQESALNHEHNHIVNAFETECLIRGVRLATIEIDFYNSVESRLAAARIAGGDSTLGYILDVWWYPAESFRRAYLAVLNRLTLFKKPIAVLDELGSFELPDQFAANPLIQTYTIESRRAGERMARFLMNLGHRSVLFISMLHHTRWSRDRYDGIVAQFLRAGLSRGVALAANDVDVDLPSILTVSGIADADVRGLISIDRTPEQVADMETTWMAFKRAKRAPYAGYPRFDAATRDGLLAVLDLARRHPGHYLPAQTCVGALNALEVLMVEACLTPLLEKAVANRAATAWICANDVIAFSALAFLKRRGMDVPADRSVVGFDNLPVAALDHGLTTLDFNAMGFIRLMLDFIGRPPRPRGRCRNRTVEVEGIIMERETTGKPPAPGR